MNPIGKPFSSTVEAIAVSSAFFALLLLSLHDVLMNT